MMTIAAPAMSLPGTDDILRRVLPNGITVLARENWSAPSIVIEGYLETGSLNEPEDQAGVASFTASMLSRGTKTRTFAEINEIVEAVGASVGFGADRYQTNFSTKSLTEDLDLILGVLRDELRNPAFSAEYVDKVRGMRMTALAERDNDTRQMAGLTFRELMFGAHPLGREIIGTRDSNLKIDRDALVAYYEQNYRPDGMVVAIVGAMPAEQAADRVAGAFADWTPRSRLALSFPAVPAASGAREKRVDMADKTQTDFILGWPAMRRGDPDFDQARLANTILGVFGLMGRLGENVRERQGMAYYAYSRLNGSRDYGTWMAAAGVNPTNLRRAIASVLDEIRRLQDEPVPPEEIEDSKRYLVGSLPIQLETNDGVASTLVDIEWQQLGMDYLQRYAGIIEALTAEQIQLAAQTYLDPHNYVLAIAGPDGPAA